MATIPTPTSPAGVIPTPPAWYRALSQYEIPNRGRAVRQMVDTFVPYIVLWALMVWMVQRSISYWLVLPLIFVAAGLLVRIFIFFHDCGHGSFFASRRANTTLGYIAGVLTFTPYEQWRRPHAVHHATAADLDRRGVGDIYTMTVAEYLAAPRWARIGYRISRHPLYLFGLAPLGIFLVAQRFPQPGAARRERESVAITNLALLAVLVLASLTIGLRAYLLIQLPILAITSALGVWLFYVQHQFEGGSWTRHEDWDPIQAALAGSSYYRLPKVLQWFTGNIGLHHIHHLRPRIPNYNLQRCYDETPALQAVEPLTLRGSLRSVGLDLWDEQAGQLVRCRDAARLP